MSAPSLERIGLHGLFGTTSSRLLSIATRGWFPPVMSVGASIVDVLAYPQSYSEAWMPYIAIGESNVSVDEATELVDEIHRKTADIRAVRNTYFAKAMFGLDEPTGDDYGLLESGLFNFPDEGGVMGARWTFNTAIDKDNLDDIDIECAITILHGA